MKRKRAEEILNGADTFTNKELVDLLCEFYHCDGEKFDSEEFMKLLNGEKEYGIVLYEMIVGLKSMYQNKDNAEIFSDVLNCFEN